MRSIRIGRVMGIPLELHSTFIWLILGIVVFLAVFDPSNFIPTLMLLFFLFVSVFLHELFHSVAAAGRGARVEKIILLPIGGISIAEKMPERPVDEFLIAVAGPAFNFLAVFLILLAVSALPQLPWPHSLFAGQETSSEAFNSAIMQFPLFALFWVNLVLGVFNLFIPALPMDGGRVLRAILGKLLGFNRATRIVSRISSVIAAVLFIAGFLLGNIMLLIIAVFVFLGASQESEMVAIKETMEGAGFRHVLNRKPAAAKPGESLLSAFRKMNKYNRTSLFIREKGRYAYISSEMLAGIGHKKWKTKKVSGVMKEIPAMQEGDASAKILAAMLSKGLPFVPIEKKGRFRGIAEEAEISNLYRLRRVAKGRE